MERHRAEVINDFALRSGFGQWNAIRVVLAQPIEEAMKELDAVTPIY
jgi:hypothetical protein